MSSQKQNFFQNSQTDQDNLSTESTAQTIIQNQEEIKQYTQNELPENVTEANLISEIQNLNEFKKQKSKRIKRIFNPKRILTITFPQKLNITDKNKRKYQVLVFYNDENDKVRRRIVKFGNIKQNDFVDKNENQKLYKKKIEKLKNSENVLQANFWRKNLLNQSLDLHSNFINIVKQNIN